MLSFLRGSPLQAESDKMCNAERYERTAAGKDTREGHYELALSYSADFCLK